MEKEKNFKINLKTVFVVLAVIVVGVVAGCSAYASFLISGYGGGKTIAKGVRIDGVDVGGMTEEEAASLIADRKESLTENTVELITDDVITTASFSEFDIEYKVEEAAKEAFDYGKSGNIFSRIGKCRNIRNGTAEVTTEVAVNPESVNDYVATYKQTIGGTVVENSYMVENDRIIFVNGKEGEGIDKEQVCRDLTEVLQSGKSGKVGVEFTTVAPASWDVDAVFETMCHEPTEPGYEKRDGKGYIAEAKNGYKFKKEDLAKLIKENKNNTEPYSLKVEVIPPKSTKINEEGMFTEVISEYTSSLAGSDSNRRTNVAVACASVNGSILNPDEVFSYNNALGPVTTAAGYKEATIFTSKGHEKGIGGGVCQLSSTLYSAALYGNMEIVKRKNHMYIVGYVPYGQDATVYEGDLDFRFKNNTNEPLKITAEVVNGIVTVRLLGKKPDPTLKVEIENITVGRQSPQTIVNEDPNMEEGKVVVSEKGTIGLTVDSYKKIYKNGELVSRDFLHRSVYKPINRVEIHGTRAVEVSAEPVTEEPTEEPAGGENIPSDGDTAQTVPATEETQITAEQTTAEE